jgi:hypothetical protein
MGIHAVDVGNEAEVGMRWRASMEDREDRDVVI